MVSSFFARDKAVNIDGGRRPGAPRNVAQGVRCGGLALRFTRLLLYWFSAPFVFAGSPFGFSVIEIVITSFSFVLHLFGHFFKLFNLC